MSEKNEVSAGSNSVLEKALQNTPVIVWVITGTMIAFAFTIVLIVKGTGFPLDDVGQAYAQSIEATLINNVEQSKLQFEQEMAIKKEQLAIERESKEVLIGLAQSIEEVKVEVKSQSVRLSKIENNISLINVWACRHEKHNKPGFCAAIEEEE